MSTIKTVKTSVFNERLKELLRRHGFNFYETHDAINVRIRKMIIPLKKRNQEIILVDEKNTGKRKESPKEKEVEMAKKEIIRGYMREQAVTALESKGFRIDNVVQEKNGTTRIVTSRISQSMKKESVEIASRPETTESKIHISGVAGPECEKVAEEIADAMQATITDTQHTEEYYRVQEANIVINSQNR